MSYEILPEQGALQTVIKVVGVGGCGGNAVEHMIANGAQGIEFIAVNTDHQVLQISRAHRTIQLGGTGLGAGGRPEVGREFALDSREEIADAIRGTNLLFITAGMGGGTGTGAAPVIAEVARSMGILTVGVVTRPFSFEGGPRQRIAEAGIKSLRENVDSILVILNSKLEDIDPEATMADCMRMSNDVLYRACVGIADIINTPGTVNRDFEDIKHVMRARGTAVIGVASAKGPNRAVEAAEAAISSPLLEGQSIEGARALLVYFMADDSLKMSEMKKAMGVLNTFVSGNALVLFGSAEMAELGDELRITVVATGLDEARDRVAASLEGVVEKPTPAPNVVSPLNPARVPPLGVMPEALDKAAAPTEAPQPATTTESDLEPVKVVPDFLRH